MNNTDFDPKATIYNNHPLTDVKVEVEKLKRALENINNYLEREFEQSLSKDDDLHHIPMGYTTVGDNEEHDIQIEADLIDCALRYIIDGKEAKTEEYGSLEEMNEMVLSVVDFDELVGEASELISQPDITQGLFTVAEAKGSESLLDPVYGKEFAKSVAKNPAGFGNHGELYEDSSREQRVRDMDRDER